MNTLHNASQASLYLECLGGIKVQYFSEFVARHVEVGQIWQAAQRSHIW